MEAEGCVGDGITGRNAGAPVDPTMSPAKAFDAPPPGAEEVGIIPGTYDATLLNAEEPFAPAATS